MSHIVDNREILFEKMNDKVRLDKSLLRMDLYELSFRSVMMNSHDFYRGITDTLKSRLALCRSEFIIHMIDHASVKRCVWIDVSGFKCGRFCALPIKDPFKIIRLADIARRRTGVLPTRHSYHLEKWWKYDWVARCEEGLLSSSSKDTSDNFSRFFRRDYFFPAATTAQSRKIFASSLLLLRKRRGTAPEVWDDGLFLEYAPPPAPEAQEAVETPESQKDTDIVLAPVISGSMYAQAIAGLQALFRYYVKRLIAQLTALLKRLLGMAEPQCQLRSGSRWVTACLMLSRPADQATLSIA